MTLVSDWLIDGDDFIVERPVGHAAPTTGLAHTEAAVLENAARANWVISVFSLWIRAPRPRLQAPFCSRPVHQRLAAAAAAAEDKH